VELRGFTAPKLFLQSWSSAKHTLSLQVNYVKLLEMNSFFSWHIFLEVGRTQDLQNKIYQTLGDD
jgi:hypothetical protein